MYSLNTSRSIIKNYNCTIKATEEQLETLSHDSNADPLLVEDLNNFLTWVTDLRDAEEFYLDDLQQKGE